MISDDGPDPLRNFSSHEQKTLTAALRQLTTEIHEGLWSSVPLSTNLIRQIHSRFFSGVRDHAGRIRERDWGDEYLTFGPHRSVSRRDVVAELDEMFSLLMRSARSLADNPDHPGYEEAAYRTAIWAHAKLIRIHPFEDGNGRTARAFLNVLLVRFGLRPVAMEMCRTEYIALLNEYFESGLRDIQRLIDGILRLAAEQATTG